MNDHSETMRHVADIIAGAVALGTLVKMLPAIAALLSIIWTGIRIWEWAQNKWKR